MTASRKAVMSGMRPTGRLHLGNYWGALKNWVRLQDEYRCHFAVADWHMLTTGYDDTSELQENIREMALDWLAAGVDPEKAVVFRQSLVPEHAELALLLGMITPLSWLENNPTWKEQLQELDKTGGELRTHGFLGYPVLQAADILLYDGEFVPVGKDQLPHLELSREIARRFNSLYAKGGKPILAEPQPLLTEAPKVPGVDARKMSKSYGNAVDILETPESLGTKVQSMYTDPAKIRKDDKGHPEPCEANPPGCVVYALHRLYSPCWADRGEECRAGQVGCVACKGDLLKSLAGPFAEFRERRERCSDKKGLVEDILAEGSRKAKGVAAKTMARVREAMRLS